MQPKPGGALTAVMVVLTMTTGMVEAVSFLALGPVFTAMQTGNVLFLGFALMREGGLSAAASAISLGAFALGTVAGARLESGVDARQRRWFVVALLVESCLLAVAAFAAWGLERADGSPSGRHVVVIALVALAMGVRNVTTLRAHVPDLRPLWSPGP
ncbi:YoaK family protein [Streptomyces sp. NPDC051219]|uniref:YoaK family protein n=1 Tax=Streptomyces sp. NPDC051219 TaxID=3155283 RepID=UPI00343F5860